VLLGDVLGDVGDLPVLGDVDRDQLGAGALVLREFLDDLPELVLLFVR